LDDTLATLLFVLEGKGKGKAKDLKVLRHGGV